MSSPRCPARYTIEPEAVLAASDSDRFPFTMTVLEYTTDEEARTTIDRILTDIRFTVGTSSGFREAYEGEIPLEVANQVIQTRPFSARLTGANAELQAQGLTYDLLDYRASASRFGVEHIWDVRGWFVAIP